MKFIIIKNLADDLFEPVCIADNLATAITKYSQIKNKNPESQYAILKQEEESNIHKYEQSQS